MEAFILVLIVIGFAVLISRSGDEERRKVEKDMNFFAVKFYWMLFEVS